MNLSTYFHQGLRLGIGGLLLLLAFMLCTETVLHLPFQLVSATYLLHYNLQVFHFFHHPASIYYPLPVALIIESLPVQQF
jgi:hypothetical protein